MVDFLVIGNVVAVHYDDVFPLMKDKRVFLGYSVRAGDRLFQVPDDYEFFGSIYEEVDGVRMIAVKGVRWFTSFEVEDNKELILKELGDYKMFDGQNVMNVDKTEEIPDYEGVMGVPITFIDKWCRKQFDIVGIADGGSGGLDLFAPRVDGVSKFTRILIKKK